MIWKPIILLPFVTVLFLEYFLRVSVVRMHTWIYLGIPAEIFGIFLWVGARSMLRQHEGTNLSIANDSDEANLKGHVTSQVN